MKKSIFMDKYIPLGNTHYVFRNFEILLKKLVIQNAFFASWKLHFSVNMMRVQLVGCEQMLKYVNITNFDIFKT